MPDILNLRKKEIPKAETKPETHKPAIQALNWKISGEIKPHQQTVNKLAIITIDIALLLLGLFFLIFQKNIITAVFFFLIVLVTFILIYKEKKLVRWGLGHRGLEIDNRFYPYDEIKSFWIEFSPPYLKELSFKFKKWHQSYIKIPLDREDPIALRRYLTGFVQEEKHEDTIIEIISRRLGI